MKAVVIFILLTFSCLTGVAQTVTPSYTLTVNFDPSFIPKGKLTVEVKQGTGSLEFLYYTDFGKGLSIKETDVIGKTDITQLNDFFKTYDFKIKGSTDTTGRDVELIDGKKDTIYHVTSGLDGINVDGTLCRDASLKMFGFWSPKKGTENEKLIETLLGILYHSLKNEYLIAYTEDLEQYFPIGLGLRKISDHPMKYRLHGVILEDDSLQLRHFFDSLSPDRKIYIDLSNWGGALKIFYPTIKAFSMSHHKVYWLDPIDFGLKELNEIGVPPENIILEKKRKKPKVNKYKNI